MDQITVTEKKVFNNLSQARDIAVKLGDVISELIGVSITEGTPVNAALATETLTISGVVKDGETVTIGDDIYEFVADAAKTVTTVGNIPADIAANTVKAVGTLTMDTQPISGNTVTIGTKTYIFVPVGTDTADGEVSIGADVAGAQANLVAAINGTDGISDAHPQVTAGEFALNDCIITALVGGTVGNAIATTETFTAGTNVFAAVTLLTGADCAAADAVTKLVAAITAEDTQGVTAVDGAGDTVVLTAPGAAGNDIAVAETMANGAFIGTEFTGGVNATVAVGSKVLVDATYLYICLDGNTILESNWRRIALGAAY